MRLLIALDSIEGPNSKLSRHFGRCTAYCVCDTKTGELSYTKNTIDHNHPDLTPVDQIMELEPDMIFSLGLGRKAMALFKEKKIKMKTGDYKTLKEVISKVDQLEDLVSSCKH